MDWKSYLRGQQQRVVDELLAFIRIPSVSALPEHADDVAAAGAWVHARLQAAGIEHVQTLATGGHPVVYGDWLHAPGAPTVLIYGHFDVQPAAFEDGWSHPPFEPRLAGGRIYARGASDDKGNMLAPIVAVEALLRTAGALPVNVKFLLEGQEEIGSPQLAGFVTAHRELLASDFALSADGSQWSETVPTLLMSLRGICALQVDVTGPAADMHSGMYGGTIQNPLHALAELIAGLHDAAGRVAVQGFYDDVVEPTPEQRRQYARVPFDEAAYLATTGVPAVFGEAGWSTYEREWIRPTLEVNGLWGGFQGDGTKTVLPAAAHAKITCRLVAGQQPARILDLVAGHLRRHAPAGVRVNCDVSEVHGAPYSVPADHPGNRAAAAVLEQLYGVPPLHTGTGGSIPVCGLLHEELGIHTIGFSFALDDEGAHGPDEFFRLASFERAQEAYCLILQELAPA
ncbi:MAG: dipeptidase [Spirochaetaceae bacterium]|nr:dipeptidase [Spirochaetaceae bacterium]